MLCEDPSSHLAPRPIALQRIIFFISALNTPTRNPLGAGKANADGRPLALDLALDLDHAAAVPGRASMCRVRSVLGVEPVRRHIRLRDASCMSLAEPPDRLRDSVPAHPMRLLAVAT